MKKFINKLLVNHSLIYKLFLYVATIILVVYLFPKGGQFKYEFQKGKPWEYENYYAPFDFAIQKSAETIEDERQQISKESPVFFEISFTWFSPTEGLNIRLMNPSVSFSATF